MPISPFLFSPARGYRKLEVWRLGMEAVEAIYLVTIPFPRHEVYGLAGQLRRAAVSIPSNIAEGNERRTRSDQLRFLVHARGSLGEIETQLEIAYRLRYASIPQLEPTLDLLDRLGRKLHRFSDNVESRI